MNKIIEKYNNSQEQYKVIVKAKYEHKIQLLVEKKNNYLKKFIMIDIFRKEIYFAQDGNIHTWFELELIVILTNLAKEIQKEYWGEK